MVFGVAHMSEGFYPVSGANRERTAYVSVHLQIASVLIKLVLDDI